MCEWQLVGCKNLKDPAQCSVTLKQWHLHMCETAISSTQFTGRTRTMRGQIEQIFKNLLTSYVKISQCRKSLLRHHLLPPLIRILESATSMCSIRDHCWPLKCNGPLVIEGKLHAASKIRCLLKSASRISTADLTPVTHQMGVHVTFAEHLHLSFHSSLWRTSLWRGALREPKHDDDSEDYSHLWLWSKKSRQ